MDGVSILATQGETLKVSNQWAQQTDRANTTISASSWEYLGDGTLSSPTLVTPLATVTLAPQGSGVLRNTVTLGNGEVRILDRWVDVL